ncbi:hypothetical protein [Deinococcus roseus]|uniref:Uncharacterized protein n=1 Tax=Deinococcus roseus TaxID=392414 RepID=A0ABQ2D2W0_9DEIO|nr:hypothetical protein [Deinococcus roseus]GGJ43678.1 hypothetical protein GCM10008938_32470 [Deinococcus roseus]
MLPNRMIHRTEMENWNALCDCDLPLLEEDLCARPSLPSLGGLLLSWIRGMFQKRISALPPVSSSTK